MNLGGGRGDTIQSMILPPIRFSCEALANLIQTLRTHNAYKAFGIRVEKTNMNYLPPRHSGLKRVTTYM